LGEKAFKNLLFYVESTVFLFEAISKIRQHLFQRYNHLIKKLTWKKAYIGVIAGVISLIIFHIDQLEIISKIYDGTLSYSVTLPMLFLTGVLSFIGGLGKEYKVCLAYIFTMILYDLVTNDMKTILYAGVSAVTLLLGALMSIIVKWVQDVT